MGDLSQYAAPLVILAALVVYSRVAKRMKVPKPVYWITMIAGGFLLMSIFAI